VSAAAAVSATTKAATTGVPAAEAATATLQYGYAGYNDREVAASEAAQSGVSLQPRAEKRKHWLFF
jgi:hypothetical protein